MIGRRTNAQRRTLVESRRRTYGVLFGALMPTPAAPPAMHPDCVDCGCQYAEMRGYPECPGQCATLPSTTTGA